MSIKRDFYNSSLQKFLLTPDEEILKDLLLYTDFSTEKTQKHAWKAEIQFLKGALAHLKGQIFFEFIIPRMGKRIDIVVVINKVLFLLEFKVGQSLALSADLDQVWDYALDLKNFHETSHNKVIVPVLVVTQFKHRTFHSMTNSAADNIFEPICVGPEDIRLVIDKALDYIGENKVMKSTGEWEKGRYSPTPTIIEAAAALYRSHSVADITRSDATAKNLKTTRRVVDQLIQEAKKKKKKIVCFVTGVPGAGKTLVGLDVATKHMNAVDKTTAVFLSGNGPLVSILREALTRDRVLKEKEKGNKVKKGEILGRVKSFIQNVHHFRDEYLKDTSAPHDHVAIFDEAQRAWNHEQTARFMKAKKDQPNFAYSEPEFLISCLDRHKSWAVIVCLVGGGQEINTGEAGIKEWFDSITRSFPKWEVFVSPNIVSSEYDCAVNLKLLKSKTRVTHLSDLHLSASMRSFRAEHLSGFIKSLLDKDIKEAKRQYSLIKNKYPLVITRDIAQAKKWLKNQSRGSERYGIVVSSQAYRLKPLAIDVRSSIDPIHWFLDRKEDVRSSYYLEDVATEFHVQGLELDWTCVTWDGDFRSTADGWSYNSFVGSKWNKIKKEERKLYLKNAYRVLLTRARQGMVILVPKGDPNDHTRMPDFYDSTFNYLLSIGIPQIV